MVKPMKLAAKKSCRSLACLAILAAPTLGCASMKPPSQWFSKSSPTAPPDSSSWTDSVTGAGKGITDGFKTMGSTMTSAVGKAKNAVVSTFSGAPSGDLDSEVSLANLPNKNSLGPEIWVTNGQVYEMKGNFAAAMDNYTKALEREPDNLPALQSVARLHLRQEQFTKAVEAYQQVVRVSPTAEHYSELSSAQQKAGRLPDAQASIQKAISIDPATHRYRNNLAGILVAGGRSDEAVRELQQVFPPAVANYNVAYLHFMNKNSAAAQQHLQAALQADPNLQPARDLLNALTAGQTAQTAMNTMNTAGQIYRAVQSSSSTAPGAATLPTNTLTGSTLPGNATIGHAVHGNPAPTTGLPSLPVSNQFAPPTSTPSYQYSSQLPPPPQIVR